MPRNAPAGPAVDGLDAADQLAGLVVPDVEAEASRRVAVVVHGRQVDLGPLAAAVAGAIGVDRFPCAGDGVGAVASGDLGFGRIVVSETEAPNMLANLV